MPHPFYKIVVKPEGRRFVLFNEASGAICGDRLYKGDKPQPWPFPGQDEWWRHTQQKDADRAALKLQRYLDGKPAKSESKTKDKQDS